ncbi:CGNR zinc finger domain-containing protein [Microbispora bryophytorum]|uniref:CGNR zinc finger domain-containing protein n=1 Tax=Microbispora bryophytorum TaxID=1460882 RepID=UPI003407EC9E
MLISVAVASPPPPPPGCAGLFLDTSRGANRRWCSMNTCGNKVKKARLAEG